jgi:hypothetical protein
MIKRTILLALLLAGAFMVPAAGRAAPTTSTSAQQWLLSLPYTIDGHFGSSLAIADFDRDGHGDLVVGAPGDLADRVRTGQVYVYPGGATGPGAAQPLARPRPRAGGEFGTALATGDVDRDGYPDLVAAGNGAIVLFLGGAGGLRPAVEHTEGDGFGATLAVADFNRDGYADVAVGAPARRSGTGAVVVFPGSASGLGAGRAVTQGPHGGVSEPGDHFGAALAAGDFDADGYADLAVGAPDEAVGRGRAGGAVTVLRGSAGGLRGGAVLTQASAGGVVEPGDRFGAALAAGDLDGDRRADLVVGAPGEAPGRLAAGGAVHVFRGKLGYGGALVLQEAAGGVTEHGDGFGTALATGDLDRDGRADLVAGAPGEAPGGGVLVLPGGPSVQGGRFVTESDFGLPPQPGSRMGAALAVGDVTGDGRPEVAIAGPDMLVAGLGGAGAVRLWRP